MKYFKNTTYAFAVILIANRSVNANGQFTDSSFEKIKHTLQVKYFDKNSSVIRRQYQYDSSKYFSQIYLLPGRWSIDKKKKEFELEGSVWIINGRSKNQDLDTQALENFEVFLASSINGELINKRVVATNCLRQLGEDNGFTIKVKFKDTDRLYLTNCSNDLLQEWEIGSLLKRQRLLSTTPILNEFRF
jgi:hypothetical protein